MVQQVKKRDGRIVPFDRNKIERAVRAAFLDIGNGYSDEDIKKVVRAVLYRITQIYGDDGVPTVEEINDIVEITLMKHGYYDVAKAFIMYRKKKEDERKEKMRVWGLDKWVEDPVLKKFSVNALRVLASRYPIRDENGKIVELPSEVFRRVAVGVAIAELLYHRKVFDKSGGHKARYPENVDFVELENLNVAIFDYPLNRYMWERLYERFKELAEQGKMKVSWEQFVELVVDRKIIDDAEYYAKEWYEYMINQVFMPNTPTLVNSGRPLYMLSACFVLDIEDSLESIMQTAYDLAMIQRAGGGTGFDFSKLRPEGDRVSKTSGTSSGAVSFMKMYDGISDVIKQGGVRRGANMGVMQYWHPEVDKFIHAKEKNDGTSVLTTFNISVGLWEDFWKKLENDEDFELINPRDGSVWGKKNARKFFEELAYMAWAKADPGVLYFDRHNQYNIMREKWGDITATNPCGEEALYPYEACNLLSINVWKFVKEDGNGRKYFDWDEYAKVILSATRFLDDVIDVNKYPLEKISRAVKKTRRIGLGFMGVAEALYELGIPYNSEDGYSFMMKLAETNQYYAMIESVELAKLRGPFPVFDGSGYVKGALPVAGYYEVPKEKWNYDWDGLVERIKENGIRNAFLTTAPPTGSVSMVADTSSGIEPQFALAYKKSVTIGEFYYVDPVLEKVLKERGLWSDDLIKRIVDNGGSVQGIDEIPEDIRKVFVTAMDIHWLDHLLAQATFQMWTDVSISKTINMPNNVSVEDVKAAYIIGHYLGCKGVTVYRDGSLISQVLKTDVMKSRDIKPSPYSLQVLEYLRKKYSWLDSYIDWEKVLGTKFQEDGNSLFLSIGYEFKKQKSESGGKFHLDQIIQQYVESGQPVSGEDIPIVEKFLKENDLLGSVFCPICWESDRVLSSVVNEAGCISCKRCGWSKCTVA